MDAKMFCFQCQEAAKGTGCTIKGVCGKDDETANRMDLLLFVTKGVSVVATLLRNAGVEVPAHINRFVVDALFSTITNANFDIESITGRIVYGLKVREQLKEMAAGHGIELPVIDEYLSQLPDTENKTFLHPYYSIIYWFILFRNKSRTGRSLILYQMLQTRIFL